MGTDLVWHGKQDDPGLRRSLTEDLEKIFTAIDWKFEVWHSNPALNATVRFPFELRKRLLGRFPGEKEPYRYPEEEKKQVVFREGVVAHFWGRSKEHRREMSFAFLDGPDLPVTLKNRIYSLSDFDWKNPVNSIEERMAQDRKISPDELVDGGHQRVIGGIWPMALLLMLIKRLYVPGLYFADDYCIEEAAGEWAEKVRLFLSPGEEIRKLLLGDPFRLFLEGERKEVENENFPVWPYSMDWYLSRTDESKRKFRTRSWWRSLDSSGGSLKKSSPDSASAPNPRVRVNPEPECSQRFQILAEWLALKNPSRLSELYRWMGECGHILDGRAVVFQDAVVFTPTDSADLFIFPLWEMIAVIQMISQCFEVKPESLKEKLGSVTDTKEQEPADAYNIIVPVQMPPDQRGNFIRILLGAISGERDPVSSRLSTSEWVMRKTRDGKLHNWHYWDGFIVSRFVSVNPLEDILLTAVSWQVIRGLQRFVDGWEFSRSGGVAILADPVEEWFETRTSRILENAGLGDFASLVQMGKEEVRSVMFSPLVGSNRSFDEVLEYFEHTERGTAEAVLRFGVDLRDWFFGPEPGCGTFWPLAATKACRQATCLNCIQNVSGETVDMRLCALRTIRIEKEHEDFCISYQRKSDYSSFMSIFGPVYRMMAGGPTGFRPVGEP